MSFLSELLYGPYAWMLIFVIVIFFTLLTTFFYYSRDKFEPEPISRLFLAFLLGIVSVVPALILSLIMLPFIPSEFLVAILLAPVVEEFCKGWMVVHLSKHQNFDGPLDGLIYGSMVGAGFAAAENIIYGLAAFYLPDGGVTLGLTLTTIRSLTQIIGHPLYTGLMGVGVGEYKVGLHRNKYQQIWRSILLHSMWNGAASLPKDYFLVGIIIVIIISLIQLKKELSTAIQLDRQAYERGYYRDKQIYLEQQKKLLYQQQWFYQNRNQYPQQPPPQWQNQYPQQPPPQWQRPFPVQPHEQNHHQQPSLPLDERTSPTEDEVITNQDQYSDELAKIKEKKLKDDSNNQE